MKDDEMSLLDKKASNNLPNSDVNESIEKGKIAEATQITIGNEGLKSKKIYPFKTTSKNVCITIIFLEYNRYKKYISTN